MSPPLVVLVTCPNARHAARLARALLQRRLAACVSLVPGVQSLFWWEGRIDQAREVLLMIKTSAACFESLRNAVVRRHPYDVPEILALPIRHGHRPYLRWLASSLKEPSRLKK